MHGVPLAVVLTFSSEPSRSQTFVVVSASVVRNYHKCLTASDHNSTLMIDVLKSLLSSQALVHPHSNIDIHGVTIILPLLVN
jgi:hypothetical protein